MKLVLRASALNCDDSVLALIDRIVDRLADEVHRLEMPEADLLEMSRWYQSARPTRQKVLMSAVAGPPRKASSGHGPHVKVVEVDSETVRFAEKLAHTPLVILVEDREADGVLLDILVEELGWPELQALWERGWEVTPNAIEIDTAGGIGAIPQRIERAARDADRENRPLRYFVLFDSDARWPGDDNRMRVAQPMAAVRQACDEHNVPHHRWRKRCAENYIPAQVFEAMREDPRHLSHVDRFDALLRRSRIQRDHFPPGCCKKP